MTYPDPWAQQPQQQGGWGQQPPAQQQGGWGQPAPQQGWSGQPQRPAGPPPSPDDLLSGRHKAAKFEAYGQVIGGRIIEAPRTEQQTDPVTKAPQFYAKSGDPKWQVLVSVQVAEPSGEDDGVRTFYVKAGMQEAVRNAVAQSGAQRLEVGGLLQIRYVREEPNSMGGGNPKKIYDARYRPPAGDPAAVPASPPPATAPAAPMSAVAANLPSGQQLPPGSFSDEPPF